MNPTIPCYSFQSRLISGAVLLIVLFSNLEMAYAGVLNIVSTDNTGAQTFLNKDVSYYWRFRTTNPSTFDKITASFAIKTTSKTGSVTSTLYRSDISGSSLASLGSKTEPTSSFNNQFVPVVFELTTAPIQLPEYFNLELTSNASGTGNDTFYIKDPNVLGFSFTDGTTSVAGFEFLGFGAGDGTAGSTSEPSPATVPEPCSLALLSAAGLFCDSRRRRLKKKSVLAAGTSRAAPTEVQPDVVSS